MSSKSLNSAKKRRGGSNVAGDISVSNEMIKNNKPNTKMTHEQAIYLLGQKITVLENNVKNNLDLLNEKVVELGNIISSVPSADKLNLVLEDINNRITNLESLKTNLNTRMNASNESRDVLLKKTKKSVESKKQVKLVDPITENEQVENEVKTSLENLNNEEILASSMNHNISFSVKEYGALGISLIGMKFVLPNSRATFLFIGFL